MGWIVRLDGGGKKRRKITRKKLAYDEGVGDTRQKIEEEQARNNNKNNNNKCFSIRPWQQERERNIRESRRQIIGNRTRQTLFAGRWYGIV